MTLFIKCKNCNEQIRIRKSVTDRAELERLIGNPIQIGCTNCLHEELRSINDVKAKESKFISIIAFLILLLGTGAIVYLLKDYLLIPNNPYNALVIGGMLLIPSIVYVFLNNSPLRF